MTVLKNWTQWILEASQIQAIKIVQGKGWGGEWNEISLCFKDDSFIKESFSLFGLKQIE